jgi:hypothetical protein
MEDINTNPIDNYSQEHIKQLIQDRMREMTPQDRKMFARFVIFTPKQRLDELFNVTTRMKAHSIVLNRVWVRSSTKRESMELMDKELANMRILWELVRLDLEVQS